jgi:flagellar biosynthesis component FlhA
VGITVLTPGYGSTTPVTTTTPVIQPPVFRILPQSESLLNMAGVVAKDIFPFLIVAVVFALFYIRKKRSNSRDQKSKTVRNKEESEEDCIQSECKSKNTKKIYLLGNRVVIGETLEPSNSGLLLCKNW